MGKRKEYIELLRVISMCAVVITHIGSTAATDFSDTYYGSVGGVLFHSLTSLAHFAVPVFFMISGALLLNPKKEITIEKLVKKYIGKYVLVIMTFGWAYALIEEVYTAKTISINAFATSFINTLRGNTWAHMWYLYSLVGIMLILPIIKSVIEACERDESNIKYILLTMVLFLSVLPFVENLTNFKLGINYPISSVYFLYMLIGYYIDIKKLNIPTTVAALLIVICSGLLIGHAYLKVMTNNDLGLSAYSTPIILIYSVSLFSLFKHRENDIRSNRVIQYLSSVSFGIYVIHMLWINIAFKYLKINPVSPSFLIGIGVAMITLVLSAITTTILKKIPLIRKLL